MAQGSPLHGSSWARELVQLSALMDITEGDAEVVVAIIDGPVLPHANLPDQFKAKLSTIQCPRSAAADHGTFIAGILAARRDGILGGICPACTFLVRPLMQRSSSSADHPRRDIEELATLVIESVEAGASVINLSLATSDVYVGKRHALEQALNLAAARDCVIVAAAGNTATVTGSTITRHPAVLPVVGYDAFGAPLRENTIGRSIGSRGLGAPGAGVIGLAGRSDYAVGRGSSVAAPFVTGAFALLKALFPAAPGALIKIAMLAASHHRRTSIIPPLMNAGGALLRLSRAPRGASR